MVPPTVHEVLVAAMRSKGSVVYALVAERVHTFSPSDTAAVLMNIAGMCAPPQ